jgi:hypothetical protein
MTTVITKMVSDLNRAKSFFVDHLKFKPTEMGSSAVGFLLQLPEGGDKVLLHLKPKSGEIDAMESAKNDTEFRFLSDVDSEFEKLLNEVESKEVIHDFQDYLPYSDLGYFAIKGLDQEVYWVEKKDSFISQFRENEK